MGVKVPAPNRGRRNSRRQATQESENVQHRTGFRGEGQRGLGGESRKENEL